MKILTIAKKTNGNLEVAFTDGLFNYSIELTGLAYLYNNIQSLQSFLSGLTEYELQESVLTQ